MPIQSGNPPYFNYFKVRHVASILKDYIHRASNLL